MADPGYHTPLIDFFRRGEVEEDVRDLAARGVLAPRPHEQLALLVLLVDDPVPSIAASATATLDAIPPATLAAFVARADVPMQMRDFFVARGIQPNTEAPGSDEEPLVPVDESDMPALAAEPDSPRVLSALPVVDRIKVAMKGTREQRATLIRDPNRLVATAVLSSPKLNDAEVESFARMANVAEEVLRIIGTNRSWIKRYSVISALTRNPKTPPALTLRFLPRLVAKDIKALSTDRNVPEVLRIAARKIVTKSLASS